MDPLLFRFLERLLAVAIGGMSICLGFRLFAVIPKHRDTNGKITLPWNISIVLTRAAPGTFFALFGIGAVSVALLRPLELTTVAPPAGPSGPSTATTVHALYGADSQVSDSTRRRDAQALLRRRMAVLNLLPEQLAPDLPTGDRDAVLRELRRVKLELMASVWVPDEGFGEYAAFEKWVLADEPSPPPEGANDAVGLYRYGRKE
jgi:hypothetical protein